MKSIAVILILIIAGCATQNPQQASSQEIGKASAEDYLNTGYKYLSNRQTKKAMESFDQAINECQSVYASTDSKFYASRGATESLYYLVRAAADKKSASVTNSTCSDALYFKGYAALDFGQIELAEELIKRAIALSPVNSMYLSELGHIYHAKEDWQAALDIFTLSEEAAKTYSPEDVKQQELTRAMRGIGFSLIELGQLDRALEKFSACLAINPEDAMAQKEIEYIKSIKKPSSFSF